VCRFYLSRIWSVPLGQRERGGRTADRVTVERLYVCLAHRHSLREPRDVVPPNWVAIPADLGRLGVERLEGQSAVGGREVLRLVVAL
jgi:hypothetical protein